MQYTDFSWDLSTWKQTSFVFEGDDEPINRKSVFSGEKKEYNHHYLKVTSGVDQEVYISAHTYNIKHYHGDCQKHSFNMESDDFSEVLYGAPNAQMLQVINPGSHHEYSTRMMKAGEWLQITMYTHFDDSDLLPHDWSLVTWASVEPVRIEHVNEDGTPSGKAQSIQFQVQSLDSNVKIPTNFPEQEAKERVTEVTEQDFTWPLTLEEIASYKALGSPL